MKTTDSLYVQISNLVDKRIAKYISGNQSSTLQSITGVSSGSDRNINEIANELSKLFITKSEFSDMDGRIDDLALALENMVDEIISEGLDVTALNPPSDNVTISAGFGGKRGRPCRLDQSKTIEVPLDEFSSIFYITLRSYGQVNVRRSKVDDELTLAKIVVPKPGTTSAIQDDQDTDSYDAYIVSAKDAYFDGTTVFDEDSKQVIKDALGDILAEKIYGTLRLSENLKLINTQGTLEINSKELLVKDTAENVLSRFDKDGIYIFDAEGFEKAHFTGDDARVGNILVKPGSLESQNFVSGHLGSGFFIGDTGYAEFKDVLIRGKFSSSVFEYNTVTATGGNILVSHDADKLAEDMTATSTSLVTDGDVFFAVGDIIWLKEGVNFEYMTIASVTNSSNYTVTRESGGSAVAWQKGTALVNLGQSNDGGIYITASESNAPYLSVFTQDGSPWNGLSTKLRLGNLNGFLGYSSDLYGIAIGETEKYLKYDPTNGLRIKGDITITGGNASVTFYQATEPSGVGEKDGDIWVDTGNDNTTYVYNSGTWNQISSAGITDSNGMIDTPSTPAGEGLYLGSTYMGYYSGAGWQSYIRNNGNFQFQGDSNNYVSWNGTALTVRGTLNADDITVGTLTGITVQGNTVQTSSSGSRVVMNADDFIAYDDAVNEIFRINLSGINIGDVTIGDYASNKGVKWDKSAETFNIKGAITATSGDFTGTVNVGSAGKVYIDGANEVIKVYDASANLMVELGKLS